MGAGSERFSAASGCGRLLYCGTARQPRFPGFRPGTSRGFRRASFTCDRATMDVRRGRDEARRSRSNARATRRAPGAILASIPRHPGSNGRQTASYVFITDAQASAAELALALELAHTDAHLFVQYAAPARR